MRIGILGGTFDPVHIGHVRVAMAAQKEARLDKVFLAPTGSLPHRRAEAPAKDRLEMARIAVRGLEGIAVSDVDMRPEPCFAADTVRLMQSEYPGADIFYIIGADKLSGLQDWHEAQALFSLCEFLVYPRAGERSQAPFGARMRWLAQSEMNLSSGMARAELARLSDAQGILPSEVAKYIALRELYRAKALPAVCEALSKKRYEHTLGTRQAAVALAQRHGQSMQRAALAGTLHDIAKEIPYPQMLAMARAAGIQDEETLSCGALLHGPVGAYIAGTRFRVQDESVTNAICAHTTGAPGMDALAMCLFLADAIEPTRKEYKGLTRLRKMADASLPKATELSLLLTRDYLSKENGRFALASQRTLEWLQKKEVAQ